MRRRLLAAAALGAVTLLVAIATTARAGGDSLSVSVDRTAISTKLGHKFVFTSTIANRGPAPAAGLIAHLNVLSLRPGLYVDPEDWSSRRTRYLAPIPAGGSRTLTWQMSAVNAGQIGIYVALLPRTGSAVRPVTGPTVRVAIADRRTLNTGGILPLVLGVPGLLGAGIVVLRLRRRA